MQFKKIASALTALLMCASTAAVFPVSAATEMTASESASATVESSGPIAYTIVPEGKPMENNVKFKITATAPKKFFMESDFSKKFSFGTIAVSAGMNTATGTTTIPATSAYTISSNKYTITTTADTSVKFKTGTEAVKLSTAIEGTSLLEVEENTVLYEATVEMVLTPKNALDAPSYFNVFIGGESYLIGLNKGEFGEISHMVVDEATPAATKTLIETMNKSTACGVSYTNNAHCETASPYACVNEIIGIGGSKRLTNADADSEDVNKKAINYTVDWFSNGNLVVKVYNQEADGVNGIGKVDLPAFLFEKQGIKQKTTAGDVPSVTATEITGKEKLTNGNAINMTGVGTGFQYSFNATKTSAFVEEAATETDNYNIKASENLFTITFTGYDGSPFTIGNTTYLYDENTQTFTENTDYSTASYKPVSGGIENFIVAKKIKEWSTFGYKIAAGAYTFDDVKYTVDYYTYSDDTIVFEVMADATANPTAMKLDENKTLLKFAVLGNPLNLGVANKYTASASENKTHNAKQGYNQETAGARYYANFKDSTKLTSQKSPLSTAESMMDQWSEQTATAVSSVTGSDNIYFGCYTVKLPKTLEPGDSYYIVANSRVDKLTVTSNDLKVSRDIVKHPETGDNVTDLQKVSEAFKVPYESGVNEAGLSWSIDENGGLTIEGKGTIEQGFFNDEIMEKTTEVYLPDEGVKLGTGAFKDFKSLTFINFPESMTEIPDNAFMNCTNLTGIDIHSELTIGKNAFAGCENLEYADIPASVTSIADNAFDGCNVVRFQGSFDSYAEEYAHKHGIPFVDLSIQTPDGDNGRTSDGLSWNSVKAILTVSGKGAMIDYTGTTKRSPYRALGDTKVVISSGVENVGDYAFYGCDLTTVELADTVTRIGDGAFASCEILSSVELSKNLTEIESMAFADCKALETIKIPASVKNIGKDAFKNCSKLTIVGEAGSFAETYASENNIPFVAEEPAAELVYGDADGSGKTDIIDVIKVNKFILGVGELEHKDEADVDGNGQVDSSDSLNVLKIALDMLTKEDILKLRSK